MQAREQLKQKGIIGQEEFSFERSAEIVDEAFYNKDKIIIQTEIPEINLKKGLLGQVIEKNEHALTIDFQGTKVELTEEYGAISTK